MLRTFIKRIASALVGERTLYRISHRPSRKEIDADRSRAGFYRKFISPGDICFDVGANVGNRVAPLLSIGAKVIAVEPQPACHHVLGLRFGDRITLVRKGLDAGKGVREMYLSDEHVLSSFSKEWIDSVKGSRFERFSWNGKIEVEMITLDDLIKTHGSPRFIKIDVEGFEANVLKGLSKPVPYISFEYITPEETSRAQECLDILNGIAPEAEYNYSKGESMAFALEQWISYAAMRDVLRSKEFEESGFGDIYFKHTDRS